MGTVEGPALQRRLHRAPAGAPRHPAEPKIRICRIISYHIISYDRAAAGALHHPARTGRARELGTCVARARACCGGEEEAPPCPCVRLLLFASVLFRPCPGFRLLPWPARCRPVSAPFPAHPSAPSLPPRRPLLRPLPICTDKLYFIRLDYIIFKYVI